MSEEGLEQRKRKKGVRHDNEYKRNVIKNAKVKGTEHVNHRGQRVRAKNDHFNLIRINWLVHNLQSLLCR